jgi:hypothetical protein
MTMAWMLPAVLAGQTLERRLAARAVDLFEEILR